MMRMRRMMLSVLIMGASQMLPVVAGAADKPPLQLAVNLADGSRLVGATTLASLPLESEALGSVEIPLEKVRTIKFSPDHESVTVLFANGDTLHGSIGEALVALETSFGEAPDSAGEDAGDPRGSPSGRCRCQRRLDRLFPV